VNRCIQLAILSAAALVGTTAIAAQDRDHRDRPYYQRYEDSAHHDYHEWNEAEEQAYRRYLREHHWKYRQFDRANRRQQEQYWEWRHQHMDDDRH
jgi:hypothetical protein